MKKPMPLIGALLLTSVAPFITAQSPHPWLDARLKEQRYPCPPGKSPVRGPENAAVTIVVFDDFECPYCRAEEPTLKKVLADYPTQVRLVFKNLPLDIHSQAKHDAVVADCMQSQGKFWEAHDRFLAGEPANKVTSGADAGKLKACISQGGDGQVETDLALAKKLGLATTPSHVIDGIRIGGEINYAQFKLLIDSEIARKAGSK